MVGSEIGDGGRGADPRVLRHGDGRGGCRCHCADQADDELLARFGAVEREMSSVRALVRSRQLELASTCNALHGELSSEKLAHQRLEDAHSTLQAEHTQLKARIEAAHAERDEEKEESSRLRVMVDSLLVLLAVVTSNIRELTAGKDAPRDELKAPKEVSTRAQSELLALRLENK